MADELAATLAAFRSNYPPDAGFARPLSLLNAAEAALTLAGEWHQKAMDLGGQITLSDAGGAKAGFMMCTAQAHEDCARALREAITRALLGEEKARG